MWRPPTPPGDIIHRFYHEQLQIDNGLLEPKIGSMDKFVTWSDNPGLVLSYIDATDLPEGKLAQQYTICDNFFHSAYGGSFLNHQFLVAASAPLWEQPIPSGFQSSWDPTTRTLSDANLTIDGKYAVNTTQGAQTPHPPTAASKLLLPINNVDSSQPDYTPTIGNRLDDAGINWKWYSGGWNNALAGHPDPLFQYHHQAFGYYAKYAPFNPDGTINPATTGPGAHLQDEQNFLSDLANGTLPAVSFIKPLGPDNEHPGYAALQRGQQHVADLVAAVQQSKFWKDAVIIITYDENGGRWDHVPAPVMPDGWGLGSRVPAIIVSPFTSAARSTERNTKPFRS
jgi:phospholipase C